MQCGGPLLAPQLPLLRWARLQLAQCLCIYVIGRSPHLHYPLATFADTVVVRTAYALQFLRAKTTQLDAAGVPWDEIELGGPANVKVGCCLHTKGRNTGRC